MASYKEANTGTVYQFETSPESGRNKGSKNPTQTLCLPEVPCSPNHCPCEGLVGPAGGCGKIRQCDSFLQSMCRSFFKSQPWFFHFHNARSIGSVPDRGILLPSKRRPSSQELHKRATIPANVMTTIDSLPKETHPMTQLSAP